MATWFRPQPGTSNQAGMGACGSWPLSFTQRYIQPRGASTSGDGAFGFMLVRFGGVCTGPGNVNKSHQSGVCGGINRGVRADDLTDNKPLKFERLVTQLLQPKPKASK